MASRDGSIRSSLKAGELNAFDDQDPVGWMFFTRFNIRALGKIHLAVRDTEILEGEEEAKRDEERRER